LSQPNSVGEVGEPGPDESAVSDAEWSKLTQDAVTELLYMGRERRDEGRQRSKRVLLMVVRVEHPGGTEAAFRATSRDISSMGVGFLHGTFIYPETQCMVAVPTSDGRYAAIHGKVARCQLISGGQHEVGVEFDAPVDLATLLL